MPSKKSDKETARDAGRLASKPLTAAVAQFEKADQQLETFVRRHTRVMEELAGLVTTREEFLKLAADLLRKEDHEGPIAVGDFYRKTAPVTETYDPEKLSEDILLRPGVVTRVDTKFINNLIKAGEVDAVDATRARVTTTGTASVIKPPSYQVPSSY